MAYNRTNWVNGGTYGADAFNNIEEGILELESQIGGAGASGYAKKQAVNMAKAVSKIRQGEVTEFAFFGDSVFYGFDMMNEDGDAVQENCIPDKGTPLEGFTRSPITIYDTFYSVMNKVLDNKVKIKKKIYSGDTVWTAFHRWNPSKSDFSIINYGINDAMGGHIDSNYHPELPEGYRGNVELYIEGYRRLIEMEIDNGTAVVLMSPTKQTLNTDGLDIDTRTTIDVYEQAVKALGIEYACPVIDGNEMTKNFGNDLAIDFCHFTKEGFRAIGYRMASYFIGQSPMFPLNVGTGSYLGVNPHLDNVNIVVPTVLTNTENSPNIPMILNSVDLGENVNRAEGGLQANVTGSGSITWSFYCDRDNMVVIPSFYTEDKMDVKVQLDFGAKQGKWNNYWNCISASGVIDRNYEEPSQVTIGHSQLEDRGTGKAYGVHMITTDSPVLKITTKGWHTIHITPQPVNKPLSDIPEDFGDGIIQMFGLNFLSLDEYNRKIGK